MFKSLRTITPTLRASELHGSDRPRIRVIDQPHSPHMHCPDAFASMVYTRFTSMRPGSDGPGTPIQARPGQAVPVTLASGRYPGCMRVRSVQATAPRAPRALQSIGARLRGLRSTTGRKAPRITPEGARVKDALDMHELGVKLYRQRMRREHPRASADEIHAMVRAWLAEPPRSPSLRLPSREPHRGIR